MKYLRSYLRIDPNELHGLRSITNELTFLFWNTCKMKISIITVSYNSESTILDTINSVNNQDYPHINIFLLMENLVIKHYKL